jgi:NifB/MoaA-like Fe-S oxidoreductase
MATHGIDELMWMALTDPDFCKRLLNGQRREVLTSVSLTEAEREAVLAVKADTLEALAGALCEPELFGVM